jgi:hypothetical protein
MTSEQKPDLTLVHGHSSQHETKIRASKLVGCFYCCRIYPSTEIRRWIVERATTERTAECAHCEIDAVLPEGSDYSLSQDLLKQMEAVYFRRP